MKNILACSSYAEKQYEELVRVADMFKRNASPRHVCVDENISHKIFHWDDATINVITNGSLVLLEGEIQAKVNPVEVAKKIEGIKSVGAWEGTAKPCRVVERHQHGKVHHLHFKCSPFQVSIGLTSRIFEQLVKIAEEQK